MKHLICCAISVFIIVADPIPVRSADKGLKTFTQPDAKMYPNLFIWADTCNVYVLRDGDTALLIDLGDGSVLDHLAEIGHPILVDRQYSEHFRSSFFS